MEGKRDMLDDNFQAFVENDDENDNKNGDGNDSYSENNDKTKYSIKEQRMERIVAFMKESSYIPMQIEELIAVLAVPVSEMKVFSDALDNLIKDGRIFRTSKKRFTTPERLGFIVGRLEMNSRGFAFVIPDLPDNTGASSTSGTSGSDLQRDIFINADNLNDALHDDKVLVRVDRVAANGRRQEGEVIRILKRGVKQVVGTYVSGSYYDYVAPDNTKMKLEVIIRKADSSGARYGQKVVADVLFWNEKAHDGRSRATGNFRAGKGNPGGRIVEILGNTGTPGIDILSIARSHGLPSEFTEKVLKQAETIPGIVTEEMYMRRRDLRNLKMVTIDGEDAKDLDDAVSIQWINGDNPSYNTGENTVENTDENIGNNISNNISNNTDGGFFRLGVHIADVSYYVKENSPLDKEALSRGTSVYLVDRVIPMLPPKLSNGICSLTAGTERLAFSVIMDIDAKGRVFSSDIFESVININERMTYTSVYKILTGQDTNLEEIYRDLLPDFRMMEKLALTLRSRRVERGAIDFDFDEAKIILDESGHPIEVRRYEITLANRIIEEFMLLCNETVAERFSLLEAPFVYRVHEDPDTEKIENLGRFVQSLGYSFKGAGKIHPSMLSNLIDKVKGTKEERIISTVMLRSMQKARYSHHNLGHFGLAAKFYCHFTSPIRRYPDLIIHRIMKEYINGTMNAERVNHYNSKLSSIAQQCSERERAAEVADRDVEDLKKTEYMKDRLGSVFDGVISNITNFGIFVELENTIEGLIRLGSMVDDYYVFDESKYLLYGERNGKIFRIGDPVRVLVARADIDARQVEFVPAEAESLVFDEEGIANPLSFGKNHKGYKSKSNSFIKSKNNSISKSKINSTGKNTGNSTGNNIDKRSSGKSSRNSDYNAAKGRLSVRKTDIKTNKSTKNTTNITKTTDIDNATDITNTTNTANAKNAKNDKNAKNKNSQSGVYKNQKGRHIQL